MPGKSSLSGSIWDESYSSSSIPAGQRQDSVPFISFSNSLNLFQDGSVVISKYLVLSSLTVHKQGTLALLFCSGVPEEPSSFVSIKGKCAQGSMPGSMFIVYGITNVFKPSKLS